MHVLDFNERTLLLWPLARLAQAQEPEAPAAKREWRRTGARSAGYDRPRRDARSGRTASSPNTNVASPANAKLLPTRLKPIAIPKLRRRRSKPSNRAFEPLRGTASTSSLGRRSGAANDRPADPQARLHQSLGRVRRRRLRRGGRRVLVGRNLRAAVKTGRRILAADPVLGLP
jgi:hypothetical protein